MNGVCLAISGTSASLIVRGNFDEGKHIDLDKTTDAKSCADLIRQGFGHDFWKKRLVVAANFEKTIIRITSRTKGTFLNRGLSSKEAWELIKTVFPFGTSINEKSHIFDIARFGPKRYFCCGLPVELAEFLTALGTELTGSVHRVEAIETLEHMIFKHELGSQKKRANKLIVFPQESGYRLLFARDGLPEDVFFVTNHPKRRVDELRSVIKTIGTWEYDLKILPPGNEALWVLEYLK